MADNTLTGKQHESAVVTIANSSHQEVLRLFSIMARTRTELVMHSPGDELDIRHWVLRTSIDLSIPVIEILELLVTDGYDIHYNTYGSVKNDTIKLKLHSNGLRR